MKKFSNYNESKNTTKNVVGKKLNKNIAIIKDELDRINMDIKSSNNDKIVSENIIENINNILYFENMLPSNVVKYTNKNKPNKKYFFINNNSEIHVINNDSKLDVKLLIESLILHYNKNKIITENISNMSVIGNKNFVILKNIPQKLKQHFKNDILNLLR